MTKKIKIAGFKESWEKREDVGWSIKMFKERGKMCAKKIKRETECVFVCMTERESERYFDKEGGKTGKQR